MNPRNGPSPVATAVACVGLAVVYVAAAKLGLALAFVHANATAVWPPSGIALGALLVGGLRLWPGVLFGAFIANATTEVSLSVAAGIALGNTLEAVAGAWLVERFARGAGFLERPWAIFRFAGLAAIGATLISATIGTSTLCLGHAATWAAFAPIWWTWWLGDAAGVLLFAPAIAAFSRADRVDWTRGRRFEASALAVLLLALGRLVFATELPPMAFVSMVPLLWAAFRFGRRGAALATLGLSVLAILGALEGKGPWGPMGPEAGLMMLQAFMGVTTVVTLVTASLVAELRGDDEMKEYIDAMTTFTAKLGTDGRVLLVNRQAIAASGMTEDQLIGMSLFDGPWFTFDPEVEARVRAAFARAVSGLPVNYDEKLQVYGQVVLTINFSLVPMRDSEGRVAWVMAEGRDITAQKNAEAQLRHRTEELARSNTELETFASVASHDLQEPLRKIQLFGERLEEKAAAALDEQSRDYLARMRNAANRMSRLIEDLLAYSRVTMQAGPFEKVSLDALAREALADMESRIDQTKAQVTVGPLPQVSGDPLQLRQLLQNLVANALKYHKPGVAPKVTVRGRELAGGVEIAVEDDGIGFDIKYLDRIFRPFQRLHGRAEYEGSGMGLAICEKIVKRHGGSLTATSAPGMGAVFIVTLPSQ